MKEKPPEYEIDTLNQHAVVKEIIQTCTEATRRWVNGEVSRDYLFELMGLVGTCVEIGRDKRLEGHLSENPDLQAEADGLTAKLTEVRELLRYSRYAAATLSSRPDFRDSAELRQKLVNEQIASAPGIEFPKP
ncbi:MAG: hypothetical protein AAFV88_12480 [Planctomycetota bacterium]